MGEDLVMFKDEQGRYGLIGAAVRIAAPTSPTGGWKHGGLRCAFHGWLFDVDGKCLETPAEPDDSNLCANIRQKSYPVVEKSGILFAYLGPGEPPAFPRFRLLRRAATHTFAFKGMIDCNWLQSLEVGIDPAHTSFLHRFFEDEDPTKATARCSATPRSDSDMPMTKIMREFPRPRIEVEPTDYGFRLVTLRQISDAERACARHQSDVPQRLHHSDEPGDDDLAMACADRRHEALLVRDLHQLRRSRWTRTRCAASGSSSTSCRTTSRARTRATTTASIRTSRSTTTFTGMGADINVHDQWACEFDGRDPGSHAGASRHVRQGDQPPIAGCCGGRSISPARAASRMMVLDAAEAATITGPACVDGIGPAGDWQGYWQRTSRERQATKSWRTNRSDVIFVSSAVLYPSPERGGSPCEAWRGGVTIRGFH